MLFAAGSRGRARSGLCWPCPVIPRLLWNFFEQSQGGGSGAAPSAACSGIRRSTGPCRTQGLCPGAGGPQIQVAPHILATSTRLGSAASCAGLSPCGAGSRALLAGLSMFLLQIPGGEPCWGSFSSASVQGGMCWDRQKEVNPGMPPWGGPGPPAPCHPRRD